MAKKILIVDDDKTSLDTLTSLVEEEGFEVSTAENGRDALDKAHANPPDLIVSDILMPVMDGYTLCRQWKSDEQLKYIPFVLYTAVYTEPKEETFSLSLGADRLIIKPQKPEILVNVMQEILDEKNRIKRPPPKPLGEEIEFFRRHNEILFSKLEKKISDLEIANQKLKALDEKYRLSFENASDVIFTIDTDFTVSSVSPSVERILGYKPQDFIGRLVPDIGFIFTPESFEQAMTDMSLVFTGETIPTTIYRLVAKDGTLKFVEVSGSPIMHEGKIIGIISVARDITERERAEETLKEREKRYRTILESIQEGYYEVDLAGNYTFFNPSMAKILGYSEEEMMGMNYRTFIAEESVEKVFSYFNQVYRTGRSTRVDYEQIKSDGSKMSVESSIELMKDSFGKPIGFQGIVRDVTKRKQLEESKREADELFTQFMKYFPGSAYIKDSNRRIIQVTENVENYFGVKPDEWLGKTSEEIWPPELGAQIRRDDEEVLQGRAVESITERPQKDGIHTWLTQRFPIHRQNKPPLIGCIFMDITDRVKAEEALRVSEEKYRSLAVTADSMYLVDREYRYQFMNERHLSRLGMSLNEVIGRPYAEFHSEEDTKLFTGSVETVLESRKSLQTEHRSERDGRYFLRTFSPVKDSQDDITAITVISKDITDRKSLEENLLTSEKKHRNLVDNTLVGVYQTNLEGTILYANRAFADMFGYDSPEELMSINVRSLYKNKDDREKFIEAIKKDRSLRNYDLKLVTEDGQDKDVILSGVFDGDSILGTLVDITERKQAEKALKESEEKYRHIVENAREGIYQTTLGGRFMSANRAMATIFGYNSPEELMATITDIPNQLYVHPGDRQKLIKMAQEKGFVSEYEYQIYRKDRSVIWASTTFDIINDKDGTPLYLEGFLVDITERKQAEDTLRKREEYFRAITENASDIILVVDKKGTITYASPSVENILGYKPEGLIGKSSLDLIAPDDFQRAMHDFGKAIVTEGIVIPNTLRVRHNDGSERVLEGVGRNLIENPSVAGFVMNVRDVTDRRRMEQAIKESEEKHRNIIENMQEGYHEVDIKGNFTFFNESMRKIFGYEREELLGMNNRQYSDEENARKIYGVYNRIYRTGEPVSNFEWQIIRKDGDRRDIEVSISLIKDREDHPTGFRGIVRDTTDRKRVEEALRESEEKYRAILVNIQEGYYEVDLAGNYTFFNPSMSKILGYTKEEMMGMNYRLYTDKKTAKKTFRDFNEVYRTGIPSRADYEQIKKDGSKMFVETSVALIRDSSGQPTGFRGLVRDVTERKRAEAALRESEKRYRELTDFLPTSIFEVDETGSISAFNRTAIEVFRYNQEDYKEDMTALQFFAPEERQRVGEDIGQVIQGKSIPGQEYAFLRKDGSKFTGLIYASPIIHENKTVGIRGAIIDITDRKQAEERYRSIFDNAQEGIFQITPEGQYLTANQALATMLGYDSPEDLLTTVIDIPKQLYVNPGDRKVLLKTTEEQGPIKGFETQFYRKDGSIIWVSVNQHAVRDAGGRILYYEGFNEDITIKKDSIERIRTALKATVQAIAVMVETRDPYTAGHQRRVSDLSRAIATEMNLSIDKIDGIRTAGIIHDIGKISVPAEILTKPTALTDLEFGIIKTHAQSGYDILKDIEFPWPVARMVLEHHERINGSGYPNGLCAEETLLESRILSVADVVESVASHRPYRPSQGIDAALKEIEDNKGTLYDTGVVDACLRIFMEKGYQLKGT